MLQGEHGFLPSRLEAFQVQLQFGQFQELPVGSKTASARGAWLKDSRFAMFVHWGLYSELGGRWQDKTYYGIAEWIMNRAKIPVAEYEQVAGRFHPTEFHAAEWVQLAKDAGMRHLMPDGQAVPAHADDGRTGGPGMLFTR